MTEPLVSVIIPTYNSMLWIKDAVDSALRQTHQPVEVVVVDDGSQDGTPAYCRTMGEAVRVFEQPNRGRGSARNEGIRQARGDYIAFLDHDDILLPESVAVRLQFVARNPSIEWVATDAMEFDQTGDLQLFLDQFSWLNTDGDQFGQLLRGCYILMSTVMMRKTLAVRSGGFDSSINYGDDIEYFMRLLLVSRVGLVRIPLTRRRIHPTQGVSNTFDRWDSRMRIYGKFLRQQPDLDRRKRRMVKCARQYASYKLGEWYWGEYDKLELRRCFTNSLGINYWAPQAIAYMVLSLLPVRILRLARNIRHGV